MKRIRFLCVVLAIISLLVNPSPHAISAQAADLTTDGDVGLAVADLSHQDESSPATVYFISDITPESLIRIYQALDVELPGKVGVKLSTGESEKSNYLRPALIGELVQMLNGTIVECNTAYGGSRASTAIHLQLAKDHGFTDIAEVDILEAEDSMELPVEGGNRLLVDYVGSHFANYDSFLVLSHFKGHTMAGFGGAIKNISIGFGSAKGKGWIHSGGTSFTNIWGGERDAFLEAMADAAKSVDSTMGDNIVYISVLNRLSVDCDCDGNPDEPDMHDIGILASTDPLAIDQAAIDLVYAMPDSESLVGRIESRNGLHTLEAAESIGLGSRNPFGVVLATLVGVPMYADIFGTIPVAEALLAKGALLGTILSFMMAVTTLSLPSLIMLRKAVKPRLLGAFFAICTVGIIIVGYGFNAFQYIFI